MTIQQDIRSLDHGSLIELFKLDLTALGGTLAYFHAGTNALQQVLVWQGNSYNPWPIQVEGFEYNGRGQLPTPTMRIANIGGAITALALAYEDMIGGKVTRQRTFAKYLDAVNFPGGVNPDADPSAEFDDDIFYVERKVSETKVFVEYELSSAMDVEGVMLPLRPVIANLCQWQYRSAECGYVGGAVADINDVATTNPLLDNCSRRLTGCKYRFGLFGQLPIGAQPAVQRI